MDADQPSQTFADYYRTQWRDELAAAPDFAKVIPPDYFREEPKLNGWQQLVIKDYGRLLGDATINGTIPFMAAYRYYRELYDFGEREVEIRYQCFRALEEADREYQDEKKERDKRLKEMLDHKFDESKGWAGD